MAPSTTLPPPTPFERNRQHRLVSICFVFGCILLERLAFALSTSSIFGGMDVYDTGLFGGYGMVALFYGLFSLLAIPLSFIPDRILERRWVVALSMGLVGLGLLLTTLPMWGFLAFGLSLTAVGSAMFIPAAWVYVAHLFPKPVAQKDGAFTLLLGGYFLSSVVIYFVRGEYNPWWLLLLVAAIAIALGAVAAFAKAPLRLAAEPKIGDTPHRWQKPAVGIGLVGAVVMVLFILMVAISLAGIDFYETFFFSILRLLVLLGGIGILVAQVAKHQKAMLGWLAAAAGMFGLGVFGDGMKTGIDGWLAVGTTFRDSENSSWLETAIMAAAALGLGALWLKVRRDSIHLSFSTVKILVGMLFLALPLVFVSSIPAESTSLFMVIVIFTMYALSNALIAPPAMATSWHLTPPKSRSLAIAVLQAIRGFFIYLIYDSQDLRSFFYEDYSAFAPGTTTVLLVLIGLTMVLLSFLAVYFYRQRIKA